MPLSFVLRLWADCPQLAMTLVMFVPLISLLWLNPAAPSVEWEWSGDPIPFLDLKAL